MWVREQGLEGNFRVNFTSFCLRFFSLLFHILALSSMV